MDTQIPSETDFFPVILAMEEIKLPIKKVRVFEANALAADKLLLEKERQHQRERDEVLREVHQFQQENQLHYMTRDFDLFDPDLLKKSLPTRKKVRVFEANALAADKLLLEKERQHQRERDEVLREVHQFQQENQLLYMTRDFDLFDPDLLKKSLPTRVADEDPRLGISSCQIMAGEDLGAADRKKAQNAQQAEWAIAQMKEKALKKAHDNKIAQLEQMKKDEINRRLLEQEAQNERDRKYILQGVIDENKRLADERRALDARRRHEDMMADLAQIEAQLNSSTLTEDMNVARSALDYKGDYSRLRPDHFKGLFPDQKREIRDIQLLQIEEAKKKT
ncbi:MAG: putative coiled-coil protein associated with protofilament ribbons [Streblomastix strix]|uniref:Putative coiled-coil protein associated with protofilament ribbons n=1 Tax=Streblomastix strix TaxID=222440 RepID=A0A5J4VIN4_9EUKA|nr:MAG: putative coiled-coil protein associated with protofilament ribbons [Streblomastix strix]